MHVEICLLKMECFLTIVFFNFPTAHKKADFLNFSFSTKVAGEEKV